MTSFIYFYFEFEYRKHRTIKRDTKLRFGDAIVSRKESIHPFPDTMHTRALNLNFLVGVGSSDLGLEVPTPIGSVSSCPTKGPWPIKMLGSEVPTPPFGGPM